MDLIVWLVGGVIVFAVAAAAVGRVTSNLAQAPERYVYDIEQSVEFVAEALPSEVTAELSYDDVAMILRLFHDHLHAHGVATTAGEDTRAEGVQVVDPDDAVADVLQRTAMAGRSYRRSDVEAVIEAQVEYFTAIGVVGAAVEEPDEIDLDGSSER